MKGFGIIGTAETWRETPWTDGGWYLTSLNDAYMLGLPRVDGWYEQHPLDKFVYRKTDARHTSVTPNDIPAGYYLRPEGHLRWLQDFAKTRPLWLQQDPPPGWLHAQRYPVEHICTKYAKVLFIDPTWKKPYVAAGPSWMLLQALDQGYDHIGIWGIHLATEREYVEQRPEFEGLIRYAIGLGVRITIPKTTPICHSRHVYCYEPRLSQAQDPVRYQIALLDQQRGPLMQALIHRPWWRGTQRLLDQIAELDAEKLDLKQQLGRLQLQESLAGPEWRV